MSTAPDVIVDAAQRVLDQTEGLDPPSSSKDMLRLAAAWLDFYDETWTVLAELYDLPLFNEPRTRAADLQRDLRLMAAAPSPEEVESTP